MKIVLTIENPGKYDEGDYVLGWYLHKMWGAATSRVTQMFKLRDMYKSKEYQPITGVPKNPLAPHIVSLKNLRAISDPTYEDTLAMGTGFSDVNLWLEWMKYSAASVNKSNCYICGAAKPHLGTVPLVLPESVEECFLTLFVNMSYNHSACTEWKSKYPLLLKNPRPGAGIQVYPGNYTCYKGSTHGRNVQNFTKGYCHKYSNLNISLTQNQVYSIGDVYWICGDGKIRSRLEGAWKGECALAKVIINMHIFTESDITDKGVLKINKRSSPLSSFDPHVYIDAIGVPRGVPDEFKARDQVATGFESIFPIITVNKNVDWINYIYYNQQRFVNYTRDALQGVSEELQADSIMTFQNRMVLDMILAEKGGVCRVLTDPTSCCTYIPNNTGPTGKVTIAIKKLEDLSIELKKNSGINNPWDQYFGWFTSWKQGLMQLGIVILIVIVVIGVVALCVIPCVKRMLEKGLSNVSLYQTTLPQEDRSPDGYKNYLISYREKKDKKGKNHVV
ncbi:syncytin-A-like [Bufo gargarizans]|uniref:syncytin-A-like n=1 Tax=Bufo gargarizans TaxID=30331 RepID=UPI001CF1BC69|nr:syncytin-A-like [Bufo gargarizans]XP_044146107.1 syncytin-A-like [Bufo gargarizans]